MTFVGVRVTLFIGISLHSILFVNIRKNPNHRSCINLFKDFPCGLSDFSFTFHFHSLEKEMATHSSVLAWRIPGTGEPGGLPSMGSHRVGHD